MIVAPREGGEKTEVLGWHWEPPSSGLVSGAIGPGGP